jgi:hypothetical protein
MTFIPKRESFKPNRGVVVESVVLERDDRVALIEAEHAANEKRG